MVKPDCVNLLALFYEQTPKDLWIALGPILLTVNWAKKYIVWLLIVEKLFCQFYILTDFIIYFIYRSIEWSNRILKLILLNQFKLPLLLLISKSCHFLIDYSSQTICDHKYCFFFFWAIYNFFTFIGLIY